MTQDERLIELEELVRNEGKITLDHICQNYQISYDSARRDLVKLAKLPGIQRIRGGAILTNKQSNLPYTQRQVSNPHKEKLVEHALSLINDHDTLFLDAGTTSVLLAQKLQTVANVITNSVEVLFELGNKEGIRKCLLGGLFDDYTHAILGNVTIEQIKQYQADTAFIGVSALSEAGITANTELDAQLKMTMAQQSKVVICIATADKFNTQMMYQSCTWSDIDCLITDKQPPHQIIKKMESHDVELIVLA